MEKSTILLIVLLFILIISESFRFLKKIRTSNNRQVKSLYIISIVLNLGLMAILGISFYKKGNDIDIGGRKFLVSQLVLFLIIMKGLIQSYARGKEKEN